MSLSLYTTAQLETELAARHALAAQQADEAAVARIRTLNLRGFTVKDVILFVERPYEGEGLRFSFCLRHDGRDYDFYYDWRDWRDGHPEMVPLDWWPASQTDDLAREWVNDALQFVPPGFNEEAENSYSFRGSDEEAIARLKAAGYETMETWEDAL